MGNGQCDVNCATELCYWDFGDCVTAESPVKIYVTSETAVGPKLGTWANPYDSVMTAISALWAPYTVIYLLKGTHYLQTPDVTTNQLFTISAPFVRIQTLFCTGDAGDHLKCASQPAVLKLTTSDINFLITASLSLQDVTIRGGFSLKDGCSEAYCTYCPAVHLNETTNSMYNDRNQPIRDYATQALCDEYKTSALFQLSPESTLSLTRVRFDTIRHQPLAVILNQCGNLLMTDVFFSNIIPRRLGLNGGVIQQQPLDAYQPYYCGNFSYEGGMVELLNVGYEYSTNSLYSGFAWLIALRTITISRVLFLFNYMQIGNAKEIFGSALMFIQQFREMKVVNCTFKYNIANSGSAFYIYSGLTIPLVVNNGVATEQKVLNLLVEGNLFVNNTGSQGSVIYVKFLTDHQNVLIRNNTFINCFATKSSIMELSFGSLKGRYSIGETISVLQNGTLTSVFVPPVTVKILNMVFLSNYAPIIVCLSSIANFLSDTAVYVDDGNSLAGITSEQYIIGSFLRNTSIYLSMEPPPPAALVCDATFLITDAYSVTLSNMKFQALSCVGGSPGFTLSGTTRYVSPI